MGKAELLKQLEDERRFWDNLVAEVGEKDVNSPGVAGDWTFKDVAAHLNAWRDHTVARLETAAFGSGTPPVPWPAELGEDTDENVDAINRYFFERDRDTPLSKILEHTQDQFNRMEAAVGKLSGANLSTPGRYPWLPGHPLSAVVEGSFGHLHEEHEAGIRAWLAKAPAV
jgi:hypothetical protein